MNRRRQVFLFCLLSLAFIGCDRITKHIAKKELMNRETLSYWHDTFRLTYAENTGAALNLGDDLPPVASFWLLGMIPLVFLLFLAGYALRRSGRLNGLQLVSFALVFAGGMGNIIDRLLYHRHVTDFMNMGIHNLRTGIFNMADVCVMAGVTGLLIATIKSSIGSRNA
jgi:signal peptidase II